MNFNRPVMRNAVYLLMAVVLAGTTACSTTRPWVNVPLANGVVAPDPEDIATLR